MWMRCCACPVTQVSVCAQAQDTHTCTYTYTRQCIHGPAGELYRNACTLFPRVDTPTHTRAQLNQHVDVCAKRWQTATSARRSSKPVKNPFLYQRCPLSLLAPGAGEEAATSALVLPPSPVGAGEKAAAPSKVLLPSVGAGEAANPLSPPSAGDGLAAVAALELPSAGDGDATTASSMGAGEASLPAAVTLGDATAGLATGMTPGRREVVLPAAVVLSVVVVGSCPGARTLPGTSLRPPRPAVGVMPRDMLRASYWEAGQ